MKRIAAAILTFFLFPLAVLAGNAPDQSKSTITGTYAPADGTTSSYVTVALRDSSGNPITGSDWILITSSDTSTSFNPSSVTLDGSGVFYVKMKTTHVGYTPITVNDTTTHTIITGSIYFYTPGGIPPSAGACLDAAPGSTAQLTSATSASDNSITLTWTDASNPVTYYLVSYGVASGNYAYGNPNVGGQGTTSYTVGGLTKGTTYYFVVRAGNGCTPGAYSNELSAVAGGVASPSATPTPKVASVSATPTIAISTPTPGVHPSVTPMSSPSATVTLMAASPTLGVPLPTFRPVAAASVPESDPTTNVVLAAVIIGVLLLIGVVVWVFVSTRKPAPSIPLVSNDVIRDDGPNTPQDNDENKYIP